MDDKLYEEYLEKAYLELPQKIKKKSRFTIPNVSGKIERNRTIISNFSEISKIFGRNEEHFMKYFLKEAGVRGDKKEGTLVLYSKFNPNILNKIVRNYFNNYILCPICKRPDTTLENNELVCKACGARSKVKNI